MFPALLLLASGNCFAYEGYANGCPEYEMPIVIVAPVMDPIKMDYTKTAKELIALSDPEMMNNGDLIPAGLTKFGLKLDGQGEIIFHTVTGENGGGTCAQISRYEFSMRLEDPIVYVASEIPYGSCAYEEVMAHENRHLAAAYTMLDEVLPVTEGYIRDFLEHQGIVRGRTREEVNRILQDGIDEYLKGLNQSIIGVSKKLQLEIDSEEEYARLAEACDGEVSKIINKAIRGTPSKRRVRQDFD